MAVNRATLDRSSGAISWNSVVMFPETEFQAEQTPDWEDIVSWAYGRVDECQKDFVIPIRTRLWGAYENLSVLFPAALLTPTPGTSLCGTELPLAFLGKNSDKITFHNACLTKLIDLYIGVDKNIFAADVEWMAIIKNTANPEDAAAYFTRTTASFTDTSFAKTNFLRRRSTMAWGSKTGFTSFEGRLGVNIRWKLDVQKDPSGNYGTDNLFIGRGGLVGELECIPQMLGSSLSNSDSASLGQGTNRGVLASTGAADLTVTLAGSGGHAIVLKNAFLATHGDMFDAVKLRALPHKWRTTVGFTTGAPNATATIA